MQKKMDSEFLLEDLSIRRVKAHLVLNLVAVLTEEEVLQIWKLDNGCLLEILDLAALNTIRGSEVIDFDFLDYHSDIWASRRGEKAIYQNKKIQNSEKNEKKMKNSIVIVRQKSVLVYNYKSKIETYSLEDFMSGEITCMKVLSSTSIGTLLV